MSLKIHKCTKPFILILSLCIVIILVYVKVTNTNNRDVYYESIKSYESKSFNNKPKTILLWNSFFDRTDWYLPADEVNRTYFENEKCPETNCIITSNKTLLQNIKYFDAVLFHMAQFLPPDQYPTERSSDQHYIFVNYESPPHTKNNLSTTAEFFNLTLTFRLDSDIPKCYGYIVDKVTKQIVAPNYRPHWRQPTDNFQLDQEMEFALRNKTGMAAWFVSHCTTISNREDLAHALQKFINVDIYGYCGNLVCPNTSPECESKLDSVYKFYLSFESSLCNDYVTEKLFKALNRTVVPIVYGGADYTRFAPPYSYINAEEYASVEELGKYLKFLDENPSEYRKYFWWKKYYEITTKPPFCDICKLINNPSQREKVQYYRNIEEWWIGHQCRFKSKIIY